MNSPQENTTSQGIRIFGEKLNLLKVLEGEEGYEQSMKKPFNEICAKKPKAFIKPKTASEVCDVLRYASADHIHVSVLGGGHDPKGQALACNGFVLDMSEMKGIEIDLDSATAWVEAGVTVKELDDATCPLDLAAVNGSCPDVGVIGLILGGGFGFLSRTKGLAIDNCLQMEIVTAAGKRIIASPQSHEQLFWAVRGAGHVGFGVVVKAQIKLHELHKEYLGGRFCYLPMAAEKIGEFLHVMNEFCKGAEDEISFNIYLITKIPGVAVDYFYDGYLCDAEKKLSPFLLSLEEKFGSFEEISSDSLSGKKTTSYLKYQQRFGNEPEKTSKMWKSAFLRELTPVVIEIIIDQLQSAPISSNHHTIGLEMVGGEINRQPRDSCAYMHRDALFLYSVQAMWKPDNDLVNADTCKQWAKTAGQSLLPYSQGSYQNYADCGEATIQNRLENYFGKSNLQRLKDLKMKYDPDGILTKEHFGF